MTTLASPIGTTPMRCTMAMRAIGQRCRGGVADLAHLGQRHLRIGLVLEPRHAAAVVVVARRADEGHRRTGLRIGHRRRHGRGIDRVRRRSSNIIRATSQSVLTLARCTRPYRLRSPAESTPPHPHLPARCPRSTYSRLTANEIEAPSGARSGRSRHSAAHRSATVAPSARVRSASLALRRSRSEAKKRRRTVMGSGTGLRAGGARSAPSDGPGHPPARRPVGPPPARRPVLPKPVQWSAASHLSLSPGRRRGRAAAGSAWSSPARPPSSIRAARR